MVASEWGASVDFCVRYLSFFCELVIGIYGTDHILALEVFKSSRD